MLYFATYTIMEPSDVLYALSSEKVLFTCKELRCKKTHKAIFHPNFSGSGSTRGKGPAGFSSTSILQP